MLRVAIAALADGLHTETLRPAAEDLSLNPEIFGHVEVVVRLDVADRRILVTYQARAVATLECDRTLVPFRQPVQGSGTLLFLSPDQLPPGGGTDDEVHPLPPDAPELDLTVPVHDALVLAVPLRHVAPEAEDAELPTVFGADRDADGRVIDDRWDALRRLRDS